MTLINSIRVSSRYRQYDWRADAFIHEINHSLKSVNEDAISLFTQVIKFAEVRTFKVYYLNHLYTEEQLEGIAQHLLCDPVIEDYSLNGFRIFEPNPIDFHFMVEIAYLPGVVDNEGRTFLSALKDYLKDSFLQGTHTASGVVYLLRFQSLPSFDTETINRIKALFTSSMVNLLIERIKVVGISSSEDRDWKGCRTLFKEFFQEFNSADKVIEPYEVIPVTHIVDDNDLEELSKKYLLYLNNEEMRTIIDYYLDPKVKVARQVQGLPSEPTDAELEVIAQTWSEHCKHKIFAAKITYHEDGILKEIIDSLYQTYVKKTTADIKKTNSRLLSVFSDNSGVFRFTNEMAICMKVETHNSPSALDPFGGAITGIVGVNRDIIGTGIGAQPLFNTDIFCFGHPDYSGHLPSKLFHPHRVMKGVHKGVERGGNESGIPTINGAIVFDDRFMGKPLVFCGTGGVLPITLKVDKVEVDGVKKEIHSGDCIVMVGGRIGKDGIHGATFSSVALDEAQPASVVQIGDPIIQKKMTDFLLVARDRLLYRTLTDNGAGGLSSSVGEMALLSNGCHIELEKALLKYPALKPWEILISESQERMTLAVPPENRSSLETLAREYDVELCIIGQFTDDGFFTATYHGETVAYINLNFLHYGLPQMKLKANWVKPVHQEPQLSDELSGRSCGEVLRGLLARPNIASKENWVRQYDHEVKAITILKPFDGINRDAPMDAAVVKPIRNSNKGLVISNGLCPRLSDIDSYAMAAMGIDEAVRNAVVVGGNPEEIYALDNFCWPDPIFTSDNPDGEFKLAQLVRANQALRDICCAYRLPLISGKDSMKNDYGQGSNKISVPPTLLITVLSVISDYRNICSSHFKKIGSPIYFLGKLDGRMGGSELYNSLGWIGNEAPKVEVDENYQVYCSIHHAIQKGWILASHDISDGGLGVALAESCFGFNGGIEISLDKVRSLDIEPWKKLFSEPAGCLIVEVSKEKEGDFVNHIRQYTDRFEKIGNTIIESNFRVVNKTVGGKKSLILNEKVNELKKIWQTSLVFD